MSKVLETKVITGVVRLSYAHLFKPHRSEETAQAKYSVALLIPKSDKTTIAKINQAINAAKEQGKSLKFGGKVPANLKLPLRDGDIEKEDDEVYANHYFLNATSVTAPGLIFRNGEKITSEDDLYSGCYAKVSINLYPFNTNGNKGIAVGLNNVMKWEDGVPLSGRASATSDFESEIDENFNPYEALDEYL